MPKPSTAPLTCTELLVEAYERFLTGFSGLIGGQDRLGWLEGRRRRAYSLGSATCGTNRCEAGFRL